MVFQCYRCLGKSQIKKVNLNWKIIQNNSENRKKMPKSETTTKKKKTLNNKITHRATNKKV